MLERSASADLQGPRAEGLAALKSLMGDRMTDNAATCAFASLDGAVQILVETLQVGVPIARIEILDTRQVQAINAYYAARALRPGSSLIVTDVCVPISRLTECITQTHEDIAQVGLDAPIVGHVGDGNFHVMICVDPDNAEEVHRAEAFNDRLVARALSMDGTCTGGHGIGIGKKDKLVDELGEDAVDLMRRIKHAIDPQGIFNPGKIFVP